MAPFDRLLQRVNAFGCAGFVAILLIQVLGWVSGARSPRETFSLTDNWRLLPSLTVSAASRDSESVARNPTTYRGVAAAQLPGRTAVNQLSLGSAERDAATWSSDEDARLVAARMRYEASFREFRRRMSSTTVEPGKALPSDTIVPFPLAPQPQFAEVSNCGAQMSEVAELTQHR
jgi:hypothetical protein